MEQEGLITRVADRSDGRMARVLLTPKGKQMRDVSKETVIRFNEAVRAKIPAGQLQTFHSVIDKINTLLDNNELFK